MAKTDYSPDIQDLNNSLSYLAVSEDKLNTSSLKILNKAYSLYEGYWVKLFPNDRKDPRITDVYSFKKYVAGSGEIERIILRLTELNNAIETEPKKQEASIPPELESMVAEYRQNKADLEAEEIKSNSQKSVAQQVKIAIAHKNRNNLILENKKRRQSQGEKFQKPDDAFVALGSPKSPTKVAALATSYKAVQEVAFTNEAFSNLSPETQNKIINEAVDLNSICVTNIDVAIQSAALLVDTTDLPEEDQENISKVSSNYIHSVYDAVNAQTQQAANYQSQIAENEVVLLQLEREAQQLTGKDLDAKLIQIKSYFETNQRLINKINNLPGQFDVFINNQTIDYQKFERESKERLSKDPDTIDRIELANSTIASIHQNLENNGVKPHLFTSMDDADLLEKAIRKDLPGYLRSNSGYEAEYAAALISNPKTQNANLSPQALLLAGKDLTPSLLAQAREYAVKYPKSSLGKLYQARKDLFDSTGVQIRKIVNSSLGKEIFHVKTDISNNIVKPSSNLIGKISDKAGVFGGVLRVAQNPWGSLRSWAGRKAGELVLKRLMQSLSNETLKRGAEMLLKYGLKESIKKLAAEAAAKAAIKLGAKVGTKIALETAAQAANVVPGLGILLAIAIDVVFWVGDKVFGTLKKAFVNISKSVYGEEVKVRDLIAIPVAGIVAAGSAVGSFTAVLSTSTIVAAGSAVGIILLSIFFAVFFYLSAIVSGPLISTLVQLESQSSIKTPTSCTNIPWPFDIAVQITQGPSQTTNDCTHKGGISQSVDFGVDVGTEIKSITDGVVTFAGLDPTTASDPEGKKGYGYYVSISAKTDSGQSFQIIYGHFSSTLVSTGENVQVGQTIGLSGNTGYSTGPHLHLGYIGIDYNSCPAGGFNVNENCCTVSTCNQP